MPTLYGKQTLLTLIHSNEIEGVQNKGLRFIPYKCNIYLDNLTLVMNFYKNQI